MKIAKLAGDCKNKIDAADFKKLRVIDNGKIVS